MKGGFVYILASKSGVLYTGVTSNLDLRTVEHRLKMTEGFTKKFNVIRLVHYERFGDIRQAIAREKQIKGWLRAKKIALIESTNPTWKDLAEDHFPTKPGDPPPS
jgi:putative endonuclease